MNLLLPPVNHSVGQNGTAYAAWRAQWDQFVALLSHEIRTSLTNINLSLELLESLIGADEQKMYMDIIARNSWMISGMINELLEYQPLDEDHTNRYSAHQLLEEVLGMAGDRILLKGVVVQKKYSGEDCELLVHPSKMKIALNNIVVNAIEAMTMERKLLTLVAGYIDEGYMIAIEDTGHGISRDDLPHIFTPYFTHKPGGLGLGLSTTYGILMSNRVRISVESEEGSGTRFVLLFQQSV